MTQNTECKAKIAIVAVHGVSDQKPSESAKAIANLLLDPTTNHKRNYTSFYQRLFHIIVSPIKVKSERIDNSNSQPSENSSKWRSKLKKWWLLFIPNERGDILNKRLHTSLDELNTRSDDDVDLDFTRERLKDYCKSTVYDTICLEGEQIIADNETKKVHIYEMHWADLSRLGAGFVHIFGGLFQLLFHLSSIGRPIVDSTRIKIRETPEIANESLDNLLRWWGRFQTGSGLIISLVIPVLNLYLFIIVFSGLPITKIPEESLSDVMQIVTGVAVTVITLNWLLNKAKNSNNNRKNRIKTNPIKKFLRRKINFLRKFIALLPIVMGFISALLLDLFFKVANWDYAFLITIIWCTLLIGVFWLILVKPFDRHRPGTKNFFILIGTLLAVCSLVLYRFQTTDNPIEKIIGTSLNLVEILYLCICLAWLCFNFRCLATIGLWSVSFIKLKKLSQETFKNRPRSKQTLLNNFKQSLLITQLSLVLPAVLFLFVTFILWHLLANYSGSLLYQTPFYEPLIIPCCIPIPEFNNLFVDPNLIFTSEFVVQIPNFTSSFFSQTFIGSSEYSVYKKLTPLAFFNKLIEFAHSPVTNLISLVFIIILCIAVCAFFPAIWTDIKPSPKDNESDSISLGNWLTNGFYIIIILITLSILIAPILGLLSNAFTINDILLVKFIDNEFIDIDNIPSVFKIALYLLTVSTASLVAFSKPIKKTLQIVLDTMLDVDNYLRLYPKNDTPRARIFARYSSLLRYLYRWRDPQDNQPYDAIIIVSHSQGTVITADLLRLLSVDLDDSFPSLKNKPPIYIFTMGSPLRQLYSFAFPNLYDWICRRKQLAEQLPNMNVKEWVNLYCSGDYVGRNIWVSNNNESIYRLRKNIYPLGKKGSRINKLNSCRGMQIRESCIGAGGHIHYWNTNAPEISAEIDNLIDTIEFQKNSDKKSNEVS